MVAKKQNKKKVEKETECLDDCLFELDSLEQYILNSMQGGTDMDTDILLVLVRATKDKLDYFQQQYNFRVDKEDMFFVSDLGKFYHKCITGESLESATERVIKEWQQEKRKEIEGKS
jgi:hypothetical protein